MRARCMRGCRTPFHSCNASLQQSPGTARPIRVTRPFHHPAAHSRTAPPFPRVSRNPSSRHLRAPSSTTMSSSSKQKQQRGYNRSPLHPVYPFSACLALFTVCFWLAVYTSLPGWFHLLAGLAIASLAVALACYLFALMITWRRDMRQRVVRGQPRDEENLTTKTQERPCRRYLHQQRPRTNNRPSTKAFDAPDARGVPRAETIGLGDRRYNLEHSEAEALTMNELRVPLLDFLWVWCAPALRCLLHTRTSIAAHTTDQLQMLISTTGMYLQPVA